MKLNTANGFVHVKEEADIYVQSLNLRVTAYILKNVVPVPSLGKLIGTGKFRYTWESDIPTLEYLSTGKFIRCETKCDVPMVAPALEKQKADTK